MTTITRNRLILKSKDTTIDDSSVSFTMETDGVANFASYGPVLTHLANFFTAAGTGGTNALGRWIAPVMDRTANACTIEVYNITGHLNGTPAGAPVAMGAFTLPAPIGANAIPCQAAVTCSFRADYGTDVEFGTGTRPRARDRNRVYLGPLNDGIVDTAANGRPLVDSVAVTDILAAMFNLSETVADLDALQWNLRVWSRAAAAVKLPTTAWVDDQFDSQRRRVDPNPGSRVFRSLASV